jgi:hypothetical protein
MSVISGRSSWWLWPGASSVPYVPCVGQFGGAVAVQAVGASRVVRDGFAQGWW